MGWPKGKSRKAARSVSENNGGANAAAPPTRPTFEDIKRQQSNITAEDVARQEESLAEKMAMVDGGEGFGLGDGDGLDHVMELAQQPLPTPNDMADVWEQTIGPTPGSQKLVSVVDEQPSTVIAASKQPNLAGDSVVTQQNSMPMHLDQIPADENPMLSGSYDPDPISKALGVKGFITNQRWDWLRDLMPAGTTGGKSYEVTRFYWQSGQTRGTLKMPLAIDMFPRNGADVDKEIKLKQTLLPMHGIIYWPFRPGESVTTDMVAQIANR